MPGNYTEEQAANEVSDLQASLDPARSESLKPVIMDHVHRYLRAKSSTDKYMELEGLISFCLPYVRDRTVQLEIENLMSTDDYSFSNDFIRNYKSEVTMGVPWNVILENEYRKLIPKVKKLWFKVQTELVKQELLPWSLTYPEKLLESALIDEILNDIRGVTKVQSPKPLEPHNAIIPRIMGREGMFDRDYDATEYEDEVANMTPPIVIPDSIVVAPLEPQVVDDGRKQSKSDISYDAAATMSDILLMASKDVKSGKAPPPGLRAKSRAMKYEPREYSDEELDNFTASDDEMDAGAKVMKKMLEDRRDRT